MSHHHENKVRRKLMGDIEKAAAGHDKFEKASTRSIKTGVASERQKLNKISTQVDSLKKDFQRMIETASKRK